MNVLIAGGDPTGAQLAALLLEQKHKVSLMEHRKDVLALLHQQLPTDAIYEDQVLDLKVLEEVGIRNIDVLVACTSDDANNLVLCYLARTQFKVPRTIARINNPRHAWLFNKKMHVDVALNESSILAHLIGEEMSLGDMMILAKLRRGQFSLLELVMTRILKQKKFATPIPISSSTSKFNCARGNGPGMKGLVWDVQGSDCYAIGRNISATPLS